MKIDAAHIQKGLRRMGLGEGDIVLLHSALSSLGMVEGGADTVIQAFRNVLGEDGTLVVPTFGALGIVTEAVRNHPDAVSSVHPKASVAAIGGAAEAICRNHWKAERAHGPDTPYTRIADMGGFVCLLGVDQDRNTTLHTVEELLRLPYLKETDAVTFRTPEGEVTKSWPFFPGPHRDFISLDRRLREQGVVQVGRIGGAVVRIARSSDLIEAVSEWARTEPDIMLCNNPACRDCMEQRADLRRARLDAEAFTFAAATSLAGDYPYQIVEQCRNAGIDRIEIDSLWGMPLTRLPRKRLEQAISVFREEDLHVLALRMRSVGAPVNALLETAAAKNIPRVIVPLYQNAPEYAEQAAKSGVEISFANCGMDHRMVKTILDNVAEKGTPARLTFGPAQFAATGENPFLKSFRNGLRKFIDQLDVEDATFDAIPTQLACGNSEIKELISILRCRNYTGFMVLSAGNRTVGTLTETVQAFDKLMQEM